MAKLDNTKRKLSALTIKNAKVGTKTTRLSDGYGLYLEIRPTGGKYWRYNYRFAGKQKTLALGTYPEVSLADARAAHEKAYSLVMVDVDPSEVRRSEKESLTLEAANSFEAVCREWLNVYMTDKTEGHKVRAERFLLKHLAKLKARPIASITAQELLAVLRQVEARGTIDTAHRARQVAGQVFAYAIQTGRAERNPARDLAGALKPVKQQHRAAILDPNLLGKLLRDMDSSNAGLVVKTAMKLSPMLFQRPGEIRYMEWQELDFNNNLWEIPAEKMKMRQPHIVPLPEQAIKLLKEIQPLTGHGKYVFPSARGGSRCLSENGVRTALRDMGYSNETITPHGFRATARTLLDETLGFRVEYIEHQLAHAVKDANGRAYNRTSYLSQRNEMMRKWANYLDELKTSGEVVKLFA